MFNKIKKAIRSHEIAIMAVFVIAIILIGTICYHNIEHWNMLDSAYFSVITLTTIGYGDLYVKTDLGKIFTIFYTIIGIGMFLGFVNLITKKTVDRIKSSSEGDEYVDKYNNLRRKKGNKF